MPKPYRENDESRSRRRKSRGRGTPADWSTIDAALLGRVISVVTSQGGSIRFGYTRDQGAYAIGFLGDGEPYTDYLRPSDDVPSYFEGVIEDWTDDERPVTLRQRS